MSITKRVYIWKAVDPVSGAWHTGGGLVVVCEDGAFEETIRKHYGDILADPEISSELPELLGTAPTRILELSDTENYERVRDRIPGRLVLLESHIWRVTSVPQP